MDKQLVKIIALADQAWASLEKHRERIRAIADEGPRCSDAKLVEMVFYIVEGEICIRNHEASTVSES